MHFLFIYRSPGILGGVETLLGRMSHWLTRQGHQVTLIAFQSEHWTDILPKEVQCIPLGDRFSDLYYYWHAKRLWRTLGIAPPDIIKSFDIPSSWIACQLAAMMTNECKVIAGVYNSFMFKWYYAPESLRLWHPMRFYLDNYLNNFPANARLFCGQDQTDELEEVHRKEGVLWPIPIDTSQFLPAARKPKWGRIVSVGRLSPMKEYNFYMIDLVKALRQKGVEVSWSVYGEGAYEAQMRAQIRDQGLEEVIVLHGTVPYERFRQVLEEAYVFVGMGTAVLEAALFKVPNVIAVPYDRQGVTPGPTYRLPRGSIGPTSTSWSAFKMADEIERILRLSSSEYQVEQDRVFEHARIHQIDASMGRFVELINQAEPVRLRRLQFMAHYPRWLFQRGMEKFAERKPLEHPSVPFLANGSNARA